MAFPKDFIWGAATYAYQVEGSPSADGKCDSIWDTFCRRPKMIRNGDTGDVACDHYRRWREDVELMKTLRLPAYSFSVNWPRVLPKGSGEVCAAGLDFYDRLVDALVKAGIRPICTLYHWELPEELQRRGGWLNRETAMRFADFARAVVARLGDRVEYWLTFNEMTVFVNNGMVIGNHAPGWRLGRREILQAIHHILLAHGLGVQAIRNTARRSMKVSLSHVGDSQTPASPDDVDAVREAMYSNPNRLSWHWWSNSWLLDPLLLGRYPNDGLAAWQSDLPHMESNDLAVIHQPLDFLGVNYYGSGFVRRGADGRAERAPDPTPRDHHTAFDWGIIPSGLYWALRMHHERYGLPLLITENGMSNLDWVDLEGRVRDPQRIDFVRRHLGELHHALADGIPVLGYILWSLLDNFEWAEGYHQRFGLVHVDYETQRRTIKESGFWYRDLIATNGASLFSGNA